MQYLPKRRSQLSFNGLTLGILATLAWMMVAGLCIQYRHHVPSVEEYKSTVANVTACAAPDVEQVNQCMDEKYEALLADWRNDTGIGMILPPMLVWVTVLLRSLAVELRLFRRRQRV